MHYDEAVSLGHGFCRSRGYECHLKEAHSAEGGDKWKVKFHVRAQGAKGHLHLDYDSYSRNLLKVDEKVKARDDDHGHGRGHGKKDKKDRDWDD
jgi:hypothetical protein